MSLLPFTQELAVRLVRTALLEVADRPIPTGDKLKNTKFGQFTAFHKTVFLYALKRGLNSIHDDVSYYDVVLSFSKLNNWDNVGQCIKYVFDNNIAKIGDTSRLSL